MNKTELITKVKEHRVSLDNILQEVKTTRYKALCNMLDCELGTNESRDEVMSNLLLSIRHCEDSIMRLGMTLKAIGCGNPYPNSYKPENTTIDKTADNLKL